MINFEFDDSGFQKEIERLEKQAKELDGEHEVAFTDLFTPEFMRQHTSHESFESLLEAGGYNVNGQEDFEAIPDDEWDKHVALQTEFGDWREMQERAAKEWTKKQLGRRWPGRR